MLITAGRTTIALTAGGIRDMRRLVQRLATIKRDETDDGTVRVETERP